jgi:hypothetical protein
MLQRGRSHPRRKWGAASGAIVGIAASACCLLSLAPSASAGAAQTGPVSPVPVSGTPSLVSTGTTEQVRQLVQCGQTMYAVGRFTKIRWGGKTYMRDNIFSFSATSPFTITRWKPDANGEVNSIAFNGGNCSDAYIGGQFTSVGGTAVKNIAEINTTTGAVAPAFGHNASAQVETLLAVNGHLLVGGHFTSLNDNSTNKYMVSVNPATGQDDGFLHLNISGHYSFHGSRPNSTMIYNQQLSHSGTMELVEGDFTKVGGKARQQIFMLNLSGSAAKVTPWSSPEFDGSAGNVPGGYPYQCGDSHPFYVTSAAWSPDDSTIYLAATGFHPWNLPTGSTPRSGLCDAVSAFPATRAEVLHKWINYTGCNSLYSAAADSTNTVYVGGHEQWADNNMGCKFAGTGAIPAQGMGGFNASDGSLLLNSAGTAGRYTRARGIGVDDMLLTSAGLWMASDNLQGANSCGGITGFAGICFLPYPA